MCFTRGLKKYNNKRLLDLWFTSTFLTINASDVSNAHDLRHS